MLRDSGHHYHEYVRIDLSRSGEFALTSTGDVDNVPPYRTLEAWDLPGGAGVGGFNKSLAFLPAVQIDRIFGSSQVNTFLSSNELAIDITSSQMRNNSCDQVNYAGSSISTCERTVFMPGTAPLDLIVKDGMPEGDIMTAYNMQGFVLRFGQGDVGDQWDFDQDEDCQTLGIKNAAVRLCIRNTEVNTLQARKSPLPSASIRFFARSSPWFAPHRHGSMSQ